MSTGRLSSMAHDAADALAAAHSRAVARLSRDIADAVGALDGSR